MLRVEHDGGLCVGLEGDFSGLTWLSAYDETLKALAKHYAYTNHRGIEWSQLAAKYRPHVEKAQESDDKAAYFTAMLDLIGETRDGHCEVEPHRDDEMEA